MKLVNSLQDQNNGDVMNKEQMQRIHDRHTEAKKDFKNRCFMVIETLVGGDIEYTDIEKLKTDIYEIAHIGMQTCGNEHTNWIANMEKLFKAFEDGGLI